MTISKSVELILKFCNSHSDKKISDDGNNIEKEFISYLRTHKHRNVDEVLYKIDLAMKKGFLEINLDADNFGEAFSSTILFSDYIIERENRFSKFIYGLTGSVLTVVGGVIGALIAAFT